MTKTSVIQTCECWNNKVVWVFFSFYEKIYKYKKSLYLINVCIQPDESGESQSML